ncbi:hypothetical protein M0R45_026980 [Rubus argutus]|uniref:Uncharacterized protein n=1 Tax=Rubus argutus TaxID=59490 RepID=A0AAW1WZ80_RUBAR
MRSKPQCGINPKLIVIFCFFLLLFTILILGSNFTPPLKKPQHPPQSQKPTYQIHLLMKPKSQLQNAHHLKYPSSPHAQRPRLPWPTPSSTMPQQTSPRSKPSKKFQEALRAWSEARVPTVSDPRFSKCQLALKNLPGDVYDMEWDLIMVDAPTGVVEDKFSKAFLCEGYFREQEGRIRHFTIPSHRTRLGRPFCP